jgi:hypothetical protein
VAGILQRDEEGRDGHIDEGKGMIVEDRDEQFDGEADFGGSSIA